MLHRFFFFSFYIGYEYTTLYFANELTGVERFLQTACNHITCLGAAEWGECNVVNFNIDKGAIKPIYVAGNQALLWQREELPWIQSSDGNKLKGPHAPKWPITQEEIEHEAIQDHFIHPYTTLRDWKRNKTVQYKKTF